MAKQRYQALAALGAAAAGMAASLPYGHTFGGALAQSAFGAALVGGLADWFAVTALFGKPLGFISWRANLVARNKERILTDLTDLVEKELLTPDNIMQVLQRYDAAAVLLDYLRRQGGRETLRRVLERLLQDMTLAVRPEEMGRLADQLLRMGLERTDLAPLALRAGAWSLRQRYDDVVIAHVLAQVREALKTAEFRAILLEVLEAALARYEAGGMLRSMVNRAAGLTAEDRVDMVLQWLERFVQNLADPERPLRRRLRAWCWKQLLGLRQPERRQQLEEWKDEWLSRHPGFFAQWLTPWVQELQQEVLQGKDRLLPHQAEALTAAVEKSLSAEKDQQGALDRWMKEQLRRWLQRHPLDLASFVAASELGRKSGEELAAFVQEKVGDDLQMIRINGSVVGGLAGAFLFLLTQLVEWGVGQ